MEPFEGMFMRVEDSYVVEKDIDSLFLPCDFCRPRVVHFQQSGDCSSSIAELWMCSPQEFTSTTLTAMSLQIHLLTFVGKATCILGIRKVDFCLVLARYLAF